MRVKQIHYSGLLFVLIALLFMVSCNLQKSVTISTRGKDTTIFGGVLNPYTNKPIMLDFPNSADTVIIGNSNKPITYFLSVFDDVVKNLP